MRSRFLPLPFALCLALAWAGVAAADTGPGPDPYGLDVAVTSTSVIPKTGQVTVSGQVTCLVDFDWVAVQVDLSQVVGRLTTLRGWGYADIPGGCQASAGAASFTMSFSADSGRFAPGKANVTVYADGQGGCVEDPETGDLTCANFGWASHGPDAIRLARAH